MSKFMTSKLLSVAVLVAMGLLVAVPSATADPFVSVRIVDSGGNDSVTVGLNDVVDFKVQVLIADIGTTNNTLPKTITTLVAGKDGLTAISMDVKQSTSDQIQVSIDAGGSLVAALQTSPVNSNGTLTDRGNTYSDLIGVLGGVFLVPPLGIPVTDAPAWTDIFAGSLTVKALGTGADSVLMPAYFLQSEGGGLSAGGLKYSNGLSISMPQTATDPYFSYQGLTLQGSGVVAPALGATDADDSGDPNSFGVVVTASPIPTPSGSYAGLTTSVSGYTGGPGGVPLGSTSSMTILAGTNATGSDNSVSASWRARTTSEADLLASDVLKLTGMANDGSGTGETDPFVLQMSYDDTVPSIAGNEAALAAAGFIYLGWLNPVSGEWENAVLGNLPDTSVNVGAANVQDGWVAAGSPMDLGAWGVDTTNNVVWAVLNHNSQFAAVPEPATMAFLAMGGMAMIGAGLRRRRSRKA